MNIYYRPSYSSNLYIAYILFLKKKKEINICRNVNNSIPIFDRGSEIGTCQTTGTPAIYSSRIFYTMFRWEDNAIRDQTAGMPLNYDH